MPNDRTNTVAARLSDWDFADWTLTPIAGDASARRYQRLTGPDGRTAILMDADPATCGSMQPFVDMARHLSGIGLRAPRIYQHDLALGTLLLEDFGPNDMASVAAMEPDREISLYIAATDIIITAHNHPAPEGLARLEPKSATALVEEVAEWCPAPLPRKLLEELEASLMKYCGPAEFLSLRDYHAENLIVTADGTLGIIDFQDAVCAPMSYDLVSLLRDARRDVSAAAEAASIVHFATEKGTTADQLSASIATMAVQRNLRILGIFFRLAKQDGKAAYLSFLPRLRKHLLRDLSHPDLSKLADLCAPIMEALAHET